MKTTVKTALVAFALAAASVAPAAAQSAYDQLAASAGLSQSEAAGMTRSQIAAHFFNRGVSTADRQTIPGMADAAHGAGGTANIAAGLRMSSRDEPGLSLTEITAIQANRGVSTSDQQTVTRPINGMGADRSQLAASAGLGIDGAEGRSLTELASYLANRGVSTADRMTIVR